jgi:1-acyl-sn-glycerol-3-phosphate acyltransferase
MKQELRNSLKTVTDVGFCGGYTWLSWALATAALPWERRYKASNWVVSKIWSRGMLRYYGAEVVCTGVEHVDPNGTYVFMSNHQSHFDILTIFLTVPVSLRFVAKRELFKIPFFGWYLHAAGHVRVDRSDRAGAIRSLDGAAEQIRAGTPIVAFPEGSRSDDGEVRPFKKGPFMLALKAGVPVVPVSITGSHDVLPKGALSAKPGTIWIHYGEPIDLTGMSVDDRDRLMGLVRDAIVRNKAELDRRRSSGDPGRSPE